MAVDGDASELGCLLALRGGFCSSALLGKNASERDVWSRLSRHYLDGLLERIGCFCKLILLFVDTAQDGPAVAVFRSQSQSGLEVFHRVVEVAPLHFQNAESIGRIRRTRVEARSQLQFCGRCVRDRLSA